MAGMASHRRQSAWIEYTSPTRITFPDNNPHLHALRNDAGLEEHPGPLFTPHFAADPSISADQPRNYDYSTTLPKYIALAFINSGAADSNYANVTTYTGLIYFSGLTAGAPGLVHGGALSSAVDTVSGEFSTLKSNGFVLTKSITVHFKKFLPLSTVVKFDCTPVDAARLDATLPLRPGKDSAVRTIVYSPDDPSHVRGNNIYPFISGDMNIYSNLRTFFFAV